MFSQNKYDSGVPIYLQIIHRVRQKIVSGEWPAGDRIPGVRDLAIEFGVNPNTVQRAMSELERDGLLYSERTAGRYVTENTELIDEARQQLAGQILTEFIKQMSQMGFTHQQIVGQLELALTNHACSEQKEEEE